MYGNPYSFGMGASVQFYAFCASSWFTSESQKTTNRIWRDDHQPRKARPKTCRRLAPRQGSAVSTNSKPLDSASISDPKTSVSIYRSATIWLLMLVSTMNFLDRQVVNILAEPIKRDLHLNDTQIGLMTGLAFAVFYTVLGLPIARYSDRIKTNRVRLISICLTIWSGMTALSGLATSYLQILGARIGVGAGEAGGTPAAHSLISDTYPVERRPAALAFFGLGLPLGTLLGMGLGGGFAELFGWRQAFLLLGLPGLLLALVVWLVIPEPRKTFIDRGLATGHAREAPPLTSVLAEVFKSRAFVLLVCAMTTGSFLSYGKGVWQAIFFMRSHGLSPGVVGPVLGLIGGIGTGFGAWAGGMLASKYGAVNRQHILTAPAVGMLISLPLSMTAYMIPDWRIAAVLLLAAAIASGLTYGPTFTCVQGLVRPTSRGQATAIFLLIQNVIGLGFGPLLFGMLSDAVTPWAGTESVRWVLYVSILLAPIPAWFFWRSSLHLNKEMRS